MRRRDRFALLCTFVIALQPVSEALARRGIEPFTMLGVGEPLDRVDTFAVAELDRSALIEAADARQKEGYPHVFAEPFAVSLRPATHGTTELLADGARLWRLRIEAPGATDLNLGFSRYRLPPGATLYVFSEAHDYWEGPYTFQDNAPHGELWLPVVPGPNSTVELYVPASAEFEPELEIGQIGYGFRDKFKLESPLRQGFCNNDVICPEWDAWNDDEQAVAVYQLGGVWDCSGQMVMNTAADFKPYFLTARHCGITPTNDHTMVIYWNYESPNCGDLCCGNLSDNQTGALWRAARSDVDFCLVELEEDPDSTSNVYWAGWDRSGVAPLGCIAIHHPSTDEKAISWNDDLLTTMNSCIGGGSQTHWRVNNWEDGTTEPGSSGSGIWDPVGHYLIGFLSGGLASCTNINYDCYGKFSLAWDGASAATRLSDWLDPANTGAMNIAGSYPGGAGRLIYASNDGLDECAADPSNENGVWEPGEIVTVPVTLLALGNHTGIIGTLSASTAGVMLIEDTATWPDLNDGQAAVSNAPHFQIAIDQSFPCGQMIDFDLSLSSVEGGPWVETFAVPVGEDLAPIGLPIPIPDNLPSGVESPLSVAVNETILDVEVFVKIKHSRVGDLVLKLRSPSGTTVTLLDRPMYPQLPNGCPDANMEVTFTDAFPTDLDTHCSGSAPWYSGDAKPMTPLSAIDFESSLGTWRLIVEDHGAGGTGSIEEWQLLTDPILPGPCEICPGSTGADLVDASVAGFGLSQNRPNPFRGKTTIRFELVRSAPTSIDIFDVAGRNVRTLVERALPAGPHTIVWDGRDSQRKPVAGGIYFYRLTSGGQTEIKRMNLIR